MRLKTFLAVVMSLRSLVVFGLGCLQKDVFWLWIGFVCALVSGVFLQNVYRAEEERCPR